MVSHTTVANEYTSALWLYGRVSATSGAMYRSDPVSPVNGRGASVGWPVSSVQSDASPKSKSTAVPSWTKPMLAGLMSRCSTRKCGKASWWQ